MGEFTSRRDNRIATVKCDAALARFGVEQIAEALASKYEVLELLSIDTRAEYYLARESGFSSPICIKALSPLAARDLRQRELFYLEAFAASKLSHFNIVRTGGPQKLGQIHFCTVEHKPEAHTLRELLNRGGWLDIHTAVEVADQIASALDFAHAAGVLHLQLQPEHVLVEPNGWVIVNGFGIEGESKWRWAHATRARKLAAPYASVEQATDGAMDYRSDLYSLGAILYEMLTDRVPFDSDEEDLVRQKQLVSVPAPPYLISLDVSEEVSNVVMQLLARDPQDRFKSAAEFQIALDAAINAESYVTARLS
jgi:serine/threonine protein kinase